MTQIDRPRELLEVLAHPAFVALTRVDVKDYMLCMEDPLLGKAWAWKGPLGECITMALAELPIRG